MVAGRWRVVVGAVAFVVAVAVGGVVAWGIRGRQASRLLGVCWTILEDGSHLARYVEGMGRPADGSCERPEKLVWPRARIPLTVASASGMGEDGAAHWVLQAAVDDLNGKLGFPLFRTVGDGLVGRPSVLVYFREEMEAVVDEGGDGPRQSWLVHVDHFRLNGDRLDASVSCLAVGPSNQWGYRLLQRGLLHAAGLAVEDVERESLMYPWERKGLVPGFELPERDCELLEMLYGGVRPQDAGV